MNDPDIPLPPQAGLLARWTSLQTAWLLFAPPAVTVGLNWVLARLTERQPGTPALPLVPVSVPSGVMDLVWPVVVAVIVLMVAVLLMRRLGWRRVMPVIGVFWLLLWLGGSAALLHRHLNEQGLFLHDATALGTSAPGPVSVNAQVLSSLFIPASLRSMGGTELVLQVPGLNAPYRLLLEDPEATQIKAGDTLALQFSPGRFSGLFVTDWQVAMRKTPAPPAALQ